MRGLRDRHAALASLSPLAGSEWVRPLAAASTVLWLRCTEGSDPFLAPSLDAGPGGGAAQHDGHAAREVHGVLAPHRDGAGVALAVLAVVERARPGVGPAPFRSVHDDEPDDGAAALGRIGVLVVGGLAVGDLGEPGAQGL